MKLGRQWVYFDVDDTLVLWYQENDPALESLQGWFSLDQTGWVLLPSLGNIGKLRELSESGWTVVVWSQSGHEWAEAVLLRLGIRELVSYVLAKPHKLVDDLQSSDWLPLVELY